MVRGSQWGGGLRSPSTSPADTGASLIRHSSLPAQRYQCRMPRVGQRRWTVDRRGTTGRLRTSHECVSGRGRRYTIASRVRCGLCEKGIILPREGSVITRSTARERRHVPRSSANCTPSYFAAGGNSHSSGSWKVPHSDVMDIYIYIYIYCPTAPIPTFLADRWAWLGPGIQDSRVGILHIRRPVLEAWPG